MNRRGPLDDFFRRKLYHLETDAPMHVWDRIAQKRNDRLITTVRPRSPLHVLLASLILAAISFGPKPISSPDIAPVITIPVAPTRPSNPSVKPLVAVRNLPPAPIQVSIPISPLPAISTPLALLAPPGAEIAQAPSPELVPIPTLSNLANSVRPTVDISKCANFKVLGLHFSYAISAGPELAMRSLTPRVPDPASMAYTQKRANSEQAQISYAIAALMTAHTRQGISISSGFHFAELRERLPIKSVLEERFTIINIFGPNGEVTGVDTLHETVESEHAILNTYQTLSIPLLIGLDIPINRLTISPRAGILANILFRQQGSMYATAHDNTLLDFNTAATEQIPLFKSHLGIGYFSGINLSYKITPQLSLTAEPYIRAFPTPITSTEYPIKQQYTQTGLSLGLRYHI